MPGLLFIHEAKGYAGVDVHPGMCSDKTASVQRKGTAWIVMVDPNTFKELQVRPEPVNWRGVEGEKYHAPLEASGYFNCSFTFGKKTVAVRKYYAGDREPEWECRSSPPHEQSLFLTSPEFFRQAEYPAFRLFS